MDWVAAGLFLISAVALLGSPGPAIAALVAVGRSKGLKQGIRYNMGLQLGLAVVAAASGLGLLSIFISFPSLAYLLSIGATIYLLYLAYQIATAGVGPNSQNDQISASALAGFFLGLSNPKAYVAFISLYASHTLFPNTPSLDIFAKWLLCVGVMIIVDTIWLLIGVSLGRANLSEKAERRLNICFAITILVATLTLLI